MIKYMDSHDSFERAVQKDFYCLVQLHDPLKVGSEFSREAWPHHTTLAGVFSIRPETVVDDFEQIADSQLAFSSKVVGYDKFGDDKDRVNVALLEKTRQLLALSDCLVGALEQQGGSFKQPTFLGDRYQPHVSDHGDLSRFAIGTAVRFDQLTLVDLAPDRDKTRRRVIWQSSGEHHASEDGR